MGQGVKTEVVIKILHHWKPGRPPHTQMQTAGKLLHIYQETPEVWREGRPPEQDKSPTPDIQPTPTVEMTRAASVSPHVALTYFSSTTFTLETNLYLQACH